MASIYESPTIESVAGGSFSGYVYKWLDVVVAAEYAVTIVTAVAAVVAATIIAFVAVVPVWVLINHEIEPHE